MLLDPIKTDNYKFGRFKKCKYRLYINGNLSYTFVTTIRDEKNCIEILLSKAKNSGSNYRDYKIVKINDEGEFTLSKGKLINL